MAAVEVSGTHPEVTPAAMEANPSAEAATPRRSNRSGRKVTSHYHYFQTTCQPMLDPPPAYASLRKRDDLSRQSAPSRRERLPGYTCTVADEGKFWFRVESVNPMAELIDAPWREVYLTLRGTLLQLKDVKDDKPAKVFRTYTLQHAEIGLAPDTAHTVYIPQTRFATLIPTSKRQRVWEKNHDWYRPEPQHLLRLRAETDQVVFAHGSEERIFQLVNSLSTSIDISMAIDDRSVPRFRTVPQRRRRQTPSATNVDDPVLRAEQEQIMQEMYPSLGNSNNASRPDLTRTTTTDTFTGEARRDAAREEDEIDLAAMREDALIAGGPDRSPRPHVSRQISSSSVESSSQSIPPVSNWCAANSASFIKCEPSPQRSEAWTARYIRRCMPILLSDAPRAYEILISHGRRVKLNWKMELLEDWELKPPKYRHHNFDVPESDLERTMTEEALSQISTLPTVREADERDEHGASETSRGERGEHVEIGTVLEELSLSKVKTRRSGRESGMVTPAEVPGFMFCF